MPLFRVAAQAELAEGQKIVKVANGRKLLLARHDGEVLCTDAHCFHMGAELVGGDIEEVVEPCGTRHTCIVCPAHRYRIDMKSGHKLDRDLHGTACASASQKQRTYAVRQDAGGIWVEVPDPQAEPPLPSDRYNAPQPVAYGLGGPRPAGQQPATPAGMPPSPAQPSQPLSQGAALQFSQEAPTQQPASHVPAPPLGARVDLPHIARRRAATAAIMAKYKPPPMAEPPAPVPAAAPAAPQPQRRGLGPPPPSGQRTLFDSWGMSREQLVAAGASGDDAMDIS